MRSGTVSLLMPDLFGLSTSSGHDNDDDDEFPDEDDDHPSVYKRLRKFVSAYLPPLCGGKASSNFGNIISSRSKYGVKSGGGLMGRKSSVKSVTNPLNKTANGNYEEEGDEEETGDKMAGGQEKSVGLNVRKVVATKTFAASPVAGNIVTVGADERVQERSSVKSPSVPDSAVVIAERSEDEEHHIPSTARDDATNTLSSEEQTAVDENYWTPERIEEYHRQQAEYEAATAAYNAALAEAEAAKGTKKGKNKKKLKEEDEDDEGEDDDVEA
jgi:hypothetical protein